MILITTSRRPTRRVRVFCKDLTRVIPGSVKVNRGKKSVYEVLAEASQLGLPYVLIVETWKGNPGDMLFYRADLLGFKEPIAIFRVKGVKLQREIKKDKRTKKVNKITVIPCRERPELTEFLSRVFGGSSKDGDADVIVELKVKNEENIMSFKIGEEEVGPRVRFKVLRLGLP